MKTITKELVLLEIADIEEAISSYLERKVSISEIACELVYCIPLNTGLPDGMYLEFSVGEDDVVDSFDLFWNDDDKTYYYKDKKLSLNEKWLSIDEIFAFDTSAFKSFEYYSDSSD